jgi:hypothetical protein
VYDLTLVGPAEGKMPSAGSHPVPRRWLKAADTEVVVMPVGRPPLGAELVERTDGSPEAKQRVAVILQTLAGHMPVPQACLELAIGESRFHELRNELLQSMVSSAEARPRGRPPADSVDARVAQLQQELQSLKLDLRAAQIREELAVMLPHVLHRPRAAGEKKR